MIQTFDFSHAVRTGGSNRVVINEEWRSDGLLCGLIRLKQTAGPDSEDAVEIIPSVPHIFQFVSACLKNKRKTSFSSDDKRQKSRFHVKKKQPHDRLSVRAKKYRE